MTKTTRRRVFTVLGILGASVAGGLGLGAYSQLSDTPYRSWLGAVIRARLPGVPIPEDSLQAFVDDFAARFPPRRHQRVLVLGDGRTYRALQTIGLEVDSMQALERLVLTQFLFATDFFDLDDPAVEPLGYVGLPDNKQCFGQNPFAEFVDV